MPSPFFFIKRDGSFYRSRSMSRFVQWVQNLIERSKRLPRNLKLFLINVVAYGAAMEGISTVLLNLYLLRLGYGTEFIGTLNSAGLFVFALVSLPIGAVQRYSSRRMLQFGQLLSLVGLAGIPLAYFADTGQATLLIAFRIIGMIGLSFYFVSSNSFCHGYYSAIPPQPGDGRHDGHVLSLGVLRQLDRRSIARMVRPMVWTAANRSPDFSMVDVGRCGDHLALYLDAPIDPRGARDRLHGPR